MNEDKKNFEINDDALDAAAGGVAGSMEIRLCPTCKKLMTPVYMMIDGAMRVGSYACESCDYTMDA